MAKVKEKPGEFWGKVHYKHGLRSLCNRSGMHLTTDKKKVTCKTCKSLLKYQAKVKKEGHF